MEIMTKEQFEEIFEEFGVELNDVSDVSIYPFSPVFTSKLIDQKIVIKKTKSAPIEKAENLFMWTKDLVENGIPTVVPIESVEKNYSQIGKDVWVLYPFIYGKKYEGTSEEIFAAGKYLGEMHSFPMDKYKLGKFDWNDYEQKDYENEITDDVKFLIKKIIEFNIPNSSEISSNLDSRVTHLFKKNLYNLKKMDLPCANGSWDYKANNLIYKNYVKPVMIDPDKAILLPRIVDLALALLLFHNEMESAPARLFTIDEWKLFLKGYTEKIKFTNDEKKHWRDILEFIFFDEALWLILEDWDYAFESEEHIHQREFILDLIRFDSGRYELK